MLNPHSLKLTKFYKIERNFPVMFTLTINMYKNVYVSCCVGDGGWGEGGWGWGAENTLGDLPY